MLASELQSAIDNHLPDLKPYEELREHLHTFPELSGQEEATACTVARKLRTFPELLVHERIGGFGIAALFENGSGKTLMLRADMDALPIREAANVPFASKVTQTDRNGKTQPVMHACGHDIHTVCLLAATETLIRLRHKWSGILILIFQPAEEQGTGAQAMIDDGLYSLIPTPDVVLFQHVDPRKAGTIGIRSGPILTAADVLEVTFHGVGGHSGMPELTIDPIIMAASTVLRLQTIVSREISASDDCAIITVSTIHAGQTDNVIPHEAVISINVRTTTQDIRSRVLASIDRIIRAESAASGAEREPTVTFLRRFPPTINDSNTVEKLNKSFGSVFKDDFNPALPRINASEDFSLLATHIDRPYAVWFIGSTDPAIFDKAEKEGTVKEIPGNHTPFFSPATQPTLSIGVKAYCAAALTMLDVNTIGT